MKRRFFLLAFAAFIAPPMEAATAGTPSAQVRFDGMIGQIKSVMMQDPVQALALSRRAEAFASSIPAAQARAIAKARAQWLQGEATARLDNGLDPMPLLERALAKIERIAPADPLHADILLSRGWVAESRGQIAAGLADFQRAFALFRAASQERGEAKALQNIAGIYQDAGDADRAQRYYTQAAEVYHGDPAYTLAAYNNVGEVLRSVGRYEAAEDQYSRALAAARKSGSPLLEAHILTNLASSRIGLGDANGADRLAHQALALTNRPNAADERPFVYGVLAHVAMMRGDEPGAVALIGRTFEGMDLTRTTLPYRDFHKLAADIYARVGRNDLALAHLRAWKRLDDNVRAVAASTNAALMAARFDFSTQNLRIVQLQANRAKLHVTILVVAVAAVSLISGLMLIGLLSLRRSRNQTEDANRQLIKALQAKTEFLAMTSHEIRTPLNGILGMTQVMLADQGVGETTRARLKVVHGAGETMRALVDDILDLAKIDAGRLSINRSTTRLKALIEEAAELWCDKAADKRLTLVLDLSDCPELINEDGGRLRQVLLNLLSNAVKFTEAGGISLSAAAREDALVITVADTGIGIAPDHHDLIFEKFQQADGSTSRRFGGTGMGLAICRSLATAMDGEISVRSAVGEGSTFTLRLPLRVLEAGGIEAAAVTEGPAILLLEPNALTQRMVAKALAETGRAILPKVDVAAFLKAMVETRPESVIVQADAAGDQLADILSATRAAGLRTIVLAATDVDTAVIEATSQVIVLRKPFATAALVDAILSDLPLQAAA